MSYATTNPPMLLGGPLTGAGQRWHYRSNDVATDVDASGYFTNGDALGMRVGDIMTVEDIDTGPNTITIHRVTVVTAGGAATVSTTGLTIT
jgi:hypothetical protein